MALITDWNDKLCDHFLLVNRVGILQRLTTVEAPISDGATRRLPKTSMLLQVVVVAKTFITDTTSFGAGGLWKPYSLGEDQPLCQQPFTCLLGYSNCGGIVQDADLTSVRAFFVRSVFQCASLGSV